MYTYLFVNFIHTCTPIFLYGLYMIKYHKIETKIWDKDKYYFKFLILNSFIVSFVSKWYCEVIKRKYTLKARTFFKLVHMICLRVRQLLQNCDLRKAMTLWSQLWSKGRTRCTSPHPQALCMIRILLCVEPFTRQGLLLLFHHPCFRLSSWT